MAQHQAAEAIVHSLAGSLSGIVALTVTYPLNTISTRMQVQTKGTAVKYTSMFDAVGKIVASEGVTGLFSGLPSGWIGTAATQGVYYYWYELFRSLRGSGTRTLSTIENLLVASAAGALTATITNPIWVINTKMTVKDSAATADSKPLSKKHDNLFVTGYRIVQEKGFLALYAGLIPALILVSNPTIQYAAFEYLKTLWSALKKQGDKPSFSALQIFIMGALAKIVATVITYPYIVVKSRMQAATTPETTVQTLRNVFKDGGIAAFYKGLQTKIIGSVLNAALLLMCKEKIVVLLFALLAVGKKQPLKQ